MTTNLCSLTLTTRGTVTEPRADGTCSCGKWHSAGYTPILTLERWSAHSVNASYQRQFTNA